MTAEEALKFALLPWAAGAIIGVSALWWTLSWAVEGYGLICETIRSAKPR